MGRRYHLKKSKAVRVAARIPGDRLQGSEGCCASRQYIRSPPLGMCPQGQEITRSQCVWCSHCGAESPLHGQKMNSCTISTGLFLPTFKRLPYTILRALLLVHLWRSPQSYNRTKKRRTPLLLIIHPQHFICVSLMPRITFYFIPYHVHIHGIGPSPSPHPQTFWGRPSVPHSDPTQIPFHSAMCPPQASMCCATNCLYLELQRLALGLLELPQNYPHIQIYRLSSNFKWVYSPSPPHPPANTGWHGV